MKALSAHLVTHLDLSYNTITDEGITFLAEYLKVRLTHTLMHALLLPSIDSYQYVYTHTHTHTHRIQVVLCGH